MCRIFFVRQTCRCGRMSASVTVGCRYALDHPFPCKSCVSNPPVLPCKRSTFSEFKQILAFSSGTFLISKLMSRFFFFCGNAKRKSEHKKFWKRKGGCRGKGKNLLQKVFPFPLAGKVPQRSCENLFVFSLQPFFCMCGGQIFQPHSRRSFSKS